MRSRSRAERAVVAAADTRRTSVGVTSILNVYGKVSSWHTNCSTGQLTWSAGRQ